MPFGFLRRILLVSEQNEIINLQQRRFFSHAQLYDNRIRTVWTTIVVLL